MAAHKKTRHITWGAIVSAAQNGCGVIMLPDSQFTLVDEDIMELLEGQAWRAQTGGYVCRFVGPKKNRKCLYLHRLVLNAPPDVEVDHRHGDKKDNRRSELRLCNRVQQLGNTRKPRISNAKSQFKGVTREGEWWTASGKENYKRVRLGSFKDEVDAARAYNDWALKRFGEFALLNPV
jgi:hypothetical protein